jgi:putative transposase
MPDYRRAPVAGGTYFFTVVTFERQPLLTGDAVRHALRSAIEQTRSGHPIQIDAWVLLPDHLHCLWTLPAGDAGFSRRWSMIKRLTTRQLQGKTGFLPATNGSRNRRGESTLWQRRFWEHQIRDEFDYRRHMDYVHWNPVKHGHVTRVVDWPYSTFHRWLRQGAYVADWGGACADAEGNVFGEP